MSSKKLFNLIAVFLVCNGVYSFVTAKQDDNVVENVVSSDSFVDENIKTEAIITKNNYKDKLVERHTWNHFDGVSENSNDTIITWNDIRKKLVQRKTKMEPKKGDDYDCGTIPIHFDWRDQGCVSPVKDQGRCAACWAFSVVANIESMLKIYKEQEITLSEKFLIDCLPGSQGCSSGSLLEAYGNIVSKEGGVLRDIDYNPFNERKEECSWSKPGPPSLVAVVGFSRVRNDEDEMVKMLYKFGPLSAAINSATMEKYGNGKNFIDEPSEDDCSSDPSQMNHAVLIVGYNVYVERNTGHEVPYWIIKNSWGSEWGDHGYYYLVRGRNACGIANDVSYSKVN